VIRQLLHRLVVLWAVVTALTAQAQDPSWKTPRAYHVARQCAVASSGKVFVLYDGNYQTQSLWRSTVARDLSGALLAWDTEQNALIRTYDRCSGLSDQKIAYIRWCQAARTLVIVYENGNVDLLDETDNVTNLPQVRDASIPGKVINDLTVSGSKAYISADFGLAVIDVGNRVLEEVYRMKMAVKSTAIAGGQYVFAAKDSICSAPFGVNLNDAKQIRTLARDVTYNRVAASSDRFFASNTKDLAFFRLSEGALTPEGIQRVQRAGSLYFTDMSAEHGKVLLLRSDGHLLLIPTSDPTASPQDITCSKYLTGASFDGATYWLSEGMDGFSAYKLKNNALQSTEVRGIMVESPMRDLSYRLRYEGDRLLVAGGRNVVGTEDLNPFTASYCEGGRWYTVDEKASLEAGVKQHTDFNHWNGLDVVQDPMDASHLFVSAYRSGLEEYRDGKFVQRYDADNSPLESIVPESPAYYNYVSCSALEFDENANLWLAQQQVDVILRVKKAAGGWTELSHESLVGANKLDRFFFTSSSYNGERIRLLSSNGWTGTGLFAFTVDGKLNFASSRLCCDWLNEAGVKITPERYFCFSEESDGSIWMGTNMGLYILEDPRTVFASGTPQLHQIIINRDDGSGLADYLFDGIPITAMTRDAKGNKWVGTDGSGIYRISSDGQVQQYHYDTSNSPLPSNTVNDIAVNPVTGEVAVATMAGLALLKTGEVPPASSLDYDNILIYPNPVVPGYHGLITITGLTENAEVKILSSSGQLVWYGHSTGGMCRWNGHSRNGGRVASGIYHVVCSTEDGDEAVIARIVMMK
jgi:sugar lactone lactonase YvrE